MSTRTMFPAVVVMVLCLVASCSRADRQAEKPPTPKRAIARVAKQAASPEVPADARVSRIVFQSPVGPSFVFTETVARLPAPEQTPHVHRIYQEVYPYLESLPSSSTAFAGLIPHETWSSFSPKLLAEHILGPEGYGWGLLHAEAKRVCLKVLDNNRDELKKLVSQDLKENDTKAKTRALHIVGKLQLAEFFELVLAIFEADAALSMPAACTLRDIGDPRAIRPMVRKYPALRGNPAFGVLRSLQRKLPAEPLLVERLHSDDPEERWRAAEALAQSGDPSLILYVERLIYDEAEGVREAAANIGFCMDRDDFHHVRPFLVRALHDPSKRVRQFTAFCFASRKDAVCAPVLLELLKDGSMEESAHSNVVQAVQSLAGTYFGYHVGSDGWQPTTENNQAAIARFAEWIDQDKRGRAASASAGLDLDRARIGRVREAASNF